MKNLSEIQLDRAALHHNFDALKGLVRNGAKVAAVVKGNAYGHGMKEVAQTLEGRPDFFQVDDIDELRELRKLTTAPILVFGYIPRDSVEEALGLGAEIAVFDIGRLEAIDEAARRLGVVAKVHLKIDALLGRQGVVPADLECVLSHLRNCPNVRVATAYGHFANIEDTVDQVHMRAQVAVFEECLAIVRRELGASVGRHMSATSGLMTYEQNGASNDLVRLGIGLYGLYPSAPLARTHESLRLRPVMRWVTHLAQVKTLPAGHSIGYGLTYVTAREMRVGVVPQGYSDGYDRGFSNVGCVLVRGRRCAVLGRIAMNMFVVDLSAVADAAAEDEAVLLGTQGEEAITAEQLAAQIGTINYEITTRVSPLLPRSVANGG